MKILYRALIYFLSISILVGLLVVAHLQVRFLWKDVAVRQALLQDAPARIAHTAALNKELDASLSAMREVYATIPTHDGLVDVVAAISREALATGISAQVPIVQEGTTKGEEIPDDPFSEVRIHIVASGNPSALSSFLYRVEHLPYLLRVVSWNINTTQQAAVTSFTSIAPGDTSSVASVSGSSFAADIAVVIKKKDIVP